MPTLIENDVPVIDSGEKASIFNDYFVAQGRLPVQLYTSARDFFIISVEEGEVFRLMKMSILQRRVRVMVLAIE